jgi:hypothetical protein
MTTTHGEGLTPNPTIIDAIEEFKFMPIPEGGIDDPASKQLSARVIGINENAFDHWVEVNGINLIASLKRFYFSPDICGKKEREY